MSSSSFLVLSLLLMKIAGAVVVFGDRISPFGLNIFEPPGDTKDNDKLLKSVAASINMCLYLGGLGAGCSIKRSRRKLEKGNLFTRWATEAA